MYRGAPRHNDEFARMGGITELDAFGSENGLCVIHYSGEAVDLSLKAQKPKKFFSHADQSAAAKAVFLGPDDVEKGVARLKDMATREEQEICLT